MTGLKRRLARLEVVSRHVEGFVEPEQLKRMAAVVLQDSREAKLRALAARVFAPSPSDTAATLEHVWERLMSGGPFVPRETGPRDDSPIRKVLLQKLQALSAAGQDARGAL